MTLDDLSDNLIKMALEVKKGGEVKKFLKKEAKKLHKETLIAVKSNVGEKRGNYKKSIKVGKVYNYENSLSIRTYSTAPHAHLIEYGHIIKSRDGKEHGYKKGAYIFENAGKKFEKVFEEDSLNFLDEIVVKSGL